MLDLETYRYDLNFRKKIEYISRNSPQEISELTSHNPRLFPSNPAKIDDRLTAVSYTKLLTHESYKQWNLQFPCWINFV